MENTDNETIAHIMILISNAHYRAKQLIDPKLKMHLTHAILNVMDIVNTQTKEEVKNETI